MISKKFVAGPIQTNVYLVGDPNNHEAVVIDPALESADTVLNWLNEHGLKLKYIINTHGHWDHVADNAALKKTTGAKILIHPADQEFLAKGQETLDFFNLPYTYEPSEPDSYLEQDQQITVGSLTFRVIHTPGHSPGGCCLYLVEESTLFCGDTLFASSVGRADLPGGDMQQLISSINEKLLGLPDETKVYPGHGPSTSIGVEKRTNPYVGD